MRFGQLLVPHAMCKAVVQKLLHLRLPHPHTSLPLLHLLAPHEPCRLTRQGQGSHSSLSWHSATLQPFCTDMMQTRPAGAVTGVVIAGLLVEMEREIHTLQDWTASLKLRSKCALRGRGGQDDARGRLGAVSVRGGRWWPKEGEKVRRDAGGGLLLAY